MNKRFSNMLHEILDGNQVLFNSAGLTDFEFEFNSFITDGITGFIDYAKARANVTFL